PISFIGTVAVKCTGSLQELKSLVHDSVIQKLSSYRAQNLGARMQGLKPRDQVPTDILFKVFPGTGKTTTTQRIGKVYYDMAFLATSDVIECSAANFIGQYVGQTCPKTRKVLEKAIGKVLFIDEAFGLCYGEFAPHAVDEIIHFLAKPAGRRQDNPLPGLFHEDILFENLVPAECITLLLRELGRNKIDTEGDFLLNSKNKDYIKALQAMPDWANARDVKQVAKRILGKFLEESSNQHVQAIRTVSVKQVHDCFLLELIIQKRSRLLSLKANANTALPTQPPIASDSTPCFPQPP
ncbi:Stage V sporulation protein K, partial [Madurella mycetomatis]